MGWNMAEWFRKAHKRHLVLKASIGSSIALGIVKFCLVISWTTASSMIPPSVTNKSGDQVNISIKELLKSDAQHKHDILTGVSIFQLLLNVAIAIYFILFWHHKNKTHLRSAVVVVLGVSSIAIACATMSLATTVATNSFSAEAARRLYPDVEEQELQGQVARIVGINLTNTRVALGASLADTALQGIAVAFWVWLLPPRWRLPDQYEPVVPVARKKKAPESYTALEMTDRMETPKGSLAALFSEHERARVRQRTVLKPEPAGRQSTAGSTRSSSSFTTGRPCFHPAVSYWAKKDSEEVVGSAFGLISVMTIILLGCAGRAFQINRTYDLPVSFSWSPYLGLACPCFYTTILVIAAVLMFCRIPLNHKILPFVRIDFVILTTLAVACLAAEAAYVYGDVLSVSRTSEWSAWADAWTSEFGNLEAGKVWNDMRSLHGAAAIVQAFMILTVFLLLAMAVYLDRHVIWGGKSRVG